MNEETPIGNAETSKDDTARPPANFQEKREEFFAKREGAFLWLLAPPVLIIGVLVFITILLWLARQVGILSTLATPSRWF